MGYAGFIIAPLALACAGALGGCAGETTHGSMRVIAVRQMETKQVCVVFNPGVRRAAFLALYKEALAARGYEVHELPARAGMGDCAAVSTYDAGWTWTPGGENLRHCEIRVFLRGRAVGGVYYQREFGDPAAPDEIVRTWVERLYPPAPAVSSTGGAT